MKMITKLFGRIYVINISIYVINTVFSTPSNPPPIISNYYNVQHLYYCNPSYYSGLREKYLYSEFFWFAFPASGMNTEIYGVTFCIQSECRKMRARKLRTRSLFTQCNNPLGHIYLILLCFRSKYVTFKSKMFLETPIN